MLVHARECTERTEQHAKEVEEYALKFPNYCRKCNAWGGKTYPGVWMYADGSGEPPEFEPCLECVGSGRCGRCGKQYTDEELNAEVEPLIDEPCSACGWRPEEDGIPEDPSYDCNCHTLAKTYSVEVTFIGKVELYLSDSTTKEDAEKELKAMLEPQTFWRVLRDCEVEVMSIPEQEFKIEEADL